MAAALLAAAACSDGSAVGSATEASVVKLTEAEAGRVIDAARGDVVEVRLVAQLGTGYSWRRADDAPLPSLEASTGPGDGGQDVGGQDIQRFRLSATTTGEHVLRFVYEQPFAGGTKNARTIRFTLRVR
ncbi:protease inhibitor I42 family protein [Sphingomonas sp. LT1P40]|uniref:protease inhibitor I42 family protein n=1 Tax=Alteristakelama amylovorans TaxID=3096166 RepID=UPI002FC8FA6A